MALRKKCILPSFAASPKWFLHFSLNHRLTRKYWPRKASVVGKARQERKSRHHACVLGNECVQIPSTFDLSTTNAFQLKNIQVLAFPIPGPFDDRFFTVQVRPSDSNS